jgi:Family of unknown function (DUF5871)
MSSQVVKIHEFNVANLTLGQVKVMESGGKMCSLNYNGGKLLTQVGSLSLPYGMNAFDKAGPIKYSMDLSLRGYEENPKVKEIYAAFQALDEYMIDQGVKNSKVWFKSELDRNVVKAFYTPMVKVAKDAEGNPKPYPPTIKVNLKKNGDSFESKVFDDQKRTYEGVPLEDLLVKGAQLTTLIQCTSIWFAGSKFGTSWKALQIRMDKVPDSIRDYAFVDDDAETAPVSQRKAVPAAEEFEDDADDDAFEAPAPAPAPAPKKPSAVAAVLPTIDDGAEDHEPVPAPKKATITAKKVIGKVATKK